MTDEAVPLYHDKTVIFGRAIIPYSDAARAWALPGGKFTAYRTIAEAHAIAIDALMRPAQPLTRQE